MEGLMTSKDIPRRTISRLQDLPDEKRKAFVLWLGTRPRPWIKDEKRKSQQDGYYDKDYEAWKHNILLEVL